MRRQRSSRQQVDLERAHEALSIAWLNTRGRWRIDSDEPAVQGFHAAAIGDALEPRPQHVIAFGPGEQAADERPVVKPVPPTRIGSRPPAVMARIAAVASRAYRAAE